MVNDAPLINLIEFIRFWVISIGRQQRKLYGVMASQDCPSHADIQRSLVSFWHSVLRICGEFHQGVESLIISIEDRNDMNTMLKKKMLLSYLYYTTLYFVCISLYNHNLFISSSLLLFLMSACQLTALSLLRENFIQVYFMIFGLYSFYFYSKTDFEALKVICIAFMSHKQLLGFVDTKMLRYTIMVAELCVSTSLMIHLSRTLSFSFHQADPLIDSLKYFWIILFLPSYVSSRHLVETFKNTLQSNEDLEDKARQLHQSGFREKEQLRKTILAQEAEIQSLKDALQARQLFISSFSHEIRNSLNSIIGNIELLKLEITNEKWIKKLETCQACTEMIMEHINDVLDMAKIDANKLHLNYVSDDFFRLIDRVWNISIVRIRQKGLRGELYVSSNFPRYVEFDSHRLMQILMNLIGNATKFTIKGFIKVIFSWHENKAIKSLEGPNEEFLRYIDKMAPKTLLTIFSETYLENKGDYDPSTFEYSKDQYNTINITEEIEKRRFSPKLISQMLVVNSIFISSDSENVLSKLPSKYKYRTKTKGVIKIEVIDSGCGLSQESMHKLFQPYSQGDPSVSRTFGGTGLGLYISKRILEEMGGQIQIYSKLNIGSDFNLTFPAETSTEKEYMNSQLGGRSNSGLNLALKRTKGLIVKKKNSLFQKTMLETYLRDFNIDIEIAYNQQEALEIIKNSGPNYFSFIIAEVEALLPNDIAFCKKIRQYEHKSSKALEVSLTILTENVNDKQKGFCLDPNGDIRASKVLKLPYDTEEYKIILQSSITQSLPNFTSHLHQPKVLVVDDDPFNTAVVQAYLEKYDLECVVCTSGTEAVSRAEKEKFDVILMDLEMSGMNGFTASKLIREKYPDILILGVTGHQREKYLDKAKEHGMDNIQTKPLDFKKILSIILEVSH